MWERNSRDVAVKVDRDGEMGGGDNQNVLVMCKIVKEEI